MWPLWQQQQVKIRAALENHSNAVRHLPGIGAPGALDTLALQFVASLRREDYYRQVQRKAIAPRRADPNDLSFDAERAVAFHLQNGNVDEAAWLIFLMTHFAKPADTGWLRLKDVYGKLGAGIWDWRSVSANPADFRAWLTENWLNIRGKFGNHRKYESLRPNANRTMGDVVDSYLHWIGGQGHERMFANVVREAGNDPHVIFDVLYRNCPVASFGRLAKFDYLSLIGRYGIAPIDAGSAYLEKPSGPARGAHLLFDGAPNGTSSLPDLQVALDILDRDLGVTMKVMEDALCNWQKSPARFVHFKG